MHRGVGLTFVSTELARQDAGVELCMQQLIGCFCLANQQPSRRTAYVRAVQIRPDAPPKLRHMIAFVQTRVSARRADLHTKRKGVEDACILFGSLQIRVRMTAKHGVDEIHA